MIVDAAETKRTKAKQLRYKKAIAKEMNIDTIQEKLWEIQSDCTDVAWYFDSEDGDDSLLNALAGDEEQEWEMKVMFADLCAEVEQMLDDIEEEYITTHFNDFFAAVDGRQLLGWDSYEGDYFGLSDSYEEKLARQEADKRLERLTKKELLDAAHQCFRIAQMYMGLMHRYDCMKSALDILKDENTGYLQMVKQIEEKYEAAERDGFFDWYDSTKEFEALIQQLPQQAWLN